VTIGTRLVVVRVPGGPGAQRCVQACAPYLAKRFAEKLEPAKWIWERADPSDPGAGKEFWVIYDGDFRGDVVLTALVKEAAKGFVAGCGRRAT
jgi:hypothetical protein